MPTEQQYLKVVLPLPFRKTFEYSLPESHPESQKVDIGQRVSVKFRSRQMTGVIMGWSASPDYAADKILSADEVLDQHSLIPSELLDLCRWAANYYHHPIGEVINAALPQFLREGKTPEKAKAWVLTIEGKGLPQHALKRAKKQDALHTYLLNHEQLPHEELRSLGLNTSVTKALSDKGLIEEIEIDPADQLKNTDIDQLLKETPKELNPEQEAAINQMRYHNFHCYLLEGATGSGKTEVYLHMISRVLQAGKQVLVLIPEIGLTPQTLSRFQQRFNVNIAELHSNVSEKQRAYNWLSASTGSAKIVIGTRLASLAPMKDLGLIIIDEEHDRSYKQQDGFRYSARDLSIYRARQANIPVLLGSATPSLESLSNAIQSRYEHLRLTQRAGNAKPPVIQLQDIRQEKLHGGLSQASIDALLSTLSRGEQALVFINRRGYAQSLICHSCGWSAQCFSCDAPMTLHRQPRHLRCHHCDRQSRVIDQCPQCASPELSTQGVGTEQIEDILKATLGNTDENSEHILRVDRDVTTSKQGLEKRLSVAREGTPCILVGTQMLAKGHHFPNLTLVIIVNTDQSLLSPDFRGAEQMGQLLTQVAGRAGREAKQGTVVVQSHRPEHPLLQLLLNKGYHRFARQILNERKHTQLPPYWHMAIFRAESKRAENAITLLKLISQALKNITPPSPNIHYLGPIPAAREKVNDRFRFILQVKCANRTLLHNTLSQVLPMVDQHALSKRTRWSIDIDALETS